MTTSFDGTVVRWERERHDGEVEEGEEVTADGKRRFRRKRGGSRRLSTQDMDDIDDDY